VIVFEDDDGNSDKESTMTEPVKRKTMIVTGASQGIGAGVTKAFIKRGYNVVANSRKINGVLVRVGG
jgi:NADP-dependent 3-hydroxy acid dehydrogenase YdfG